jgi:hypothetical protein
MSVGGSVRINLDEPGHGSLARDVQSHNHQYMLLLLLLLLYIVTCYRSAPQQACQLEFGRALTWMIQEMAGLCVMYTHTAAAAAAATCRSAPQQACRLAAGCASTWTTQETTAWFVA